MGRRPARRLFIENLETRVVPGFIAPLSFDTGPSTNSVAVGDFNGDGTPDLAVAGSELSVLLGNGDGTFRPAVQYDTPGYSVVVDDFNGDGIPDVAMLGVGGVSVLLGNGDGTFGAPIRSPGPSGGSSLAVGDFNGDGIPDLAVANLLAQGTVSVLLGNGDGTFRPAVSYTTGVRSYSVAVGDFTGDGVLDLAVANQGTSPLYRDSSVSVLLGNGDGTFRRAVKYAVAEGEAVFVAVGDFKGDGVADLAVATGADSQGYGDGVSVLLGNGDGTFQPARSFAAGSYPASIVAGDVSGDGILDLVVANNSSSGVSVLLGNGDGTFQSAVNYAAGTGPVAVGDFNGDGTLDLAVLNIGNVSVLLGNGDGTFRTAPSYGVGDSPYSVAVGDFNGDGIPDLAVANGGHGGAYGIHGSVSVLLGNDDGTFQPAIDYEDPYQPVSVAVGDFNGDGIPDLVVANYGHPDVFNPGGVYVLLGNGDGTFRSQVQYPVGDGPVSVAVGDFNGDGIPDLAVANQNSNNVSVLLGNGDGTFRPAVNFAVDNVPAFVAVGDFNGDGILDLVTANYGNIQSGHDVSVLLGNGDGTFQRAVNYDRDFRSGPLSVAVGDFNGDGVPDLAVSGSAGGGVSVLLGNGDGSFQPAVNFAVGLGPVFVTVGDFNADGTPDLAVVGEGGVGVLLGNGDGTFQTTPISYVAEGLPSSVAVGDFNGDGLPDLAVTNRDSNDVSILFNDGSWPPSPGGRPGSAPSRRAAQNIRTHVSASLAPIVTALTITPSVLPSPSRPSPPMWTAPSISAAVADSLFAAAPSDESEVPVSALPLVRHETWLASRGQPRINDLDLLADTLPTLAWNQI